ncbi:hypothetical protein [Pseudooceanicola sp.]|uniref:hypothetical protein n=1 Tax=Pseudooceanicola sp. TaxID=1914328 RepID=UPI002636BBCE|nr:hypothetical protein [Pseudooceanicola sp.]MDF1854462.1 hypothetical protein [Pseudooceanicola sp.]
MRVELTRLRSWRVTGICHRLLGRDLIARLNPEADGGLILDVSNHPHLIELRLIDRLCGAMTHGGDQ